MAMAATAPGHVGVRALVEGANRVVFGSPTPPRNAGSPLVVKTVTGGCLSLSSLALMAFLLISEAVYYFTPRTTSHLLVDTSQGERPLPVSIGIDFPRTPCAAIAIAAEDSKGIRYERSRMQIHTVALDMNGVVTRDESQGVGCRIDGMLNLKKVAGSFHFSAGRMIELPNGSLQVSMSPVEYAAFNASHAIRYLSFGPAFPGQLAPLDKTEAHYDETGVQHQYYIKVVPTRYEPMFGAAIDSQQFSATDLDATVKYNDGRVSTPGIWFRFDFAPLMVRMVRERDSFLYFLTSVCGILGGVFVIFGIIDQIYYRTLGCESAKSAT